MILTTLLITHIGSWNRLSSIRFHGTFLNSKHHFIIPSP